MHALFTERLVESCYSLQIQVANNVLYCKTGLEMKRILSYQECISLRNPKKLITSVKVQMLTKGLFLLHVESQNHNPYTFKKQPCYIDGCLLYFLETM